MSDVTQANGERRQLSLSQKFFIAIQVVDTLLSSYAIDMHGCISKH
jgi:hypothetical protein